MKRTTKKKRKRKANSRLKRDFKRGPFYNAINRKGN